MMFGAVLKRSFCYGIRYQSTKAWIGKPFKSQEELAHYLSNPTSKWSVQELLSKAGSPVISKRADQIDHSTVERMLKLSGLEAKPEEYDELVSILKSQVVFIDHLHAIPESEIQQVATHQSVGALSLADIQRQIDEQKPQLDKGEEADSWDPLSLSTDSLNGNYIVKEGLIKNK